MSMNAQDRKFVNGAIANMLTTAMSVVENGLNESNANNLALLMALEEKGVITREDFDRARAKASAAIDQELSEQREKIAGKPQ